VTGGAGIFERLATEHGEISTLIRRVAVTADGSEVRKTLYARIRTELGAHARAEEQEVYSTFRTLPELAGKIDAAADEHHRIEHFLRQLDAIAIDDRRWITIFREMMRLVQKHVLEEELVVFPAAKRAISREHSHQLEARFESAKRAAHQSVL
jgi:hemerythrin superfamily protein